MLLDNRPWLYHLCNRCNQQFKSRPRSLNIARRRDLYNYWYVTLTCERLLRGFMKGEAKWFTLTSTRARRCTHYHKLLQDPKSYCCTGALDTYKIIICKWHDSVGYSWMSGVAVQLPGEERSYCANHSIQKRKKIQQTTTCCHIPRSFV